METTDDYNPSETHVFSEDEIEESLKSCGSFLSKWLENNR